MRPTHYPVSRAATIISTLAAVLAASATLLIDLHILEPEIETALQTLIAALAGPAAAISLTAGTWHKVTPTAAPTQQAVKQKRRSRRSRTR